ncbi:hypothetical protein CSKR_103575 [Clonorchis sinensis]|nr:hypothetical protein CSKR_103575 [Clonorchis sinensis]GAA31172.1 licD1 protein [Clonorchis sinensis]
MEDFLLQARSSAQDKFESDPLLLEPFLVKAYWNLTEYNLLPDLAELRWPRTEYSNVPAGSLDSDGTVIPRPAAFEPVFSKGQRALFTRLLSLFADVMSTSGLGDKFILNAGTLHGSLRHHDFIPYDEDVDVCVDKEVLPKIITLFQEYKPEYVFRYGKRLSKFYTRRIPTQLEAVDSEYSRNTSKYPWLYPALDICYYTKNDTHVHEILADGQVRTWARSVFFPLLFRPFGFRWYPTPFNSIRYLRTLVAQGPNCIRVEWDHVTESERKRSSIPCKVLGNRYAFVERSKANRPLVSSRFPGKLVNNLVVSRERLVVWNKNEVSLTVVHELYLPVHPDLASLDTYDYSRNNINELLI